MNKIILTIEDDKMQSKILKRMLEKNLHYKVHETHSANDALKFITDDNDKQTISLIILDLGLPDIPGLTLLDTLHKIVPTIPIIILSGSEDNKNSVVAFRKGAMDFLTKPPKIERLTVSIENVLKINSLTSEVSKLQKAKHSIATFSTLIGAKEGLFNTVEKAKKAAVSDIPVMIIGETGVGKEVFAQAIHAESSRNKQPFIAINCGSIPSQLVESTLFGHEKGSFTGAVEKSIGKFREAEGGTLFLDEIGELPLEVQVKLLRAIQQKEVEPVGSSTSVPINIRIISATNRNLSHEVHSGNFREDLFFRIEGIPLTIPPLRNRCDDIPILAEYFLDLFRKEDGINGKSFSKESLDFLTRQKWPGNVRELRNTIHRTLILSQKDIINIEDFLFSTKSSSLEDIKNGECISFNKVVEVISENGNIKTLKEIEDEAVEITMDHFDGNITKTSYALDIAKSTFYRKWK